MRETVSPRPKGRGLKRDGLSDHAFLGCQKCRHKWRGFKPGDIFVHEKIKLIDEVKEK